MKDAIPLITVGVIALVIGAAATWFFIGGSAPNTVRSGNSIAHEDRGSVCGGASLTPESDSGKKDAQELADARKLLVDSRKRAADLEGDLEILRLEQADTTDQKQQLEAELAERDKRIAELEDLAAAPNHLLVGFGKWIELKEIREADWKDLGSAYAEMLPLLKELAKDLSEGKQPDPETMKQIQAENMRLVAHYAKVIKKLPTHASSNGEFTHPINMANILAGQLSNAGIPLSEDQLAQLAKLGQDYEDRWDTLQQAYTENTWLLQKVYDEVVLKQWFYDGMFKITTAEQKAIAVPPEVAGRVGLDLYSPGLMLQGSFRPVRGTDLAIVKQNLKTAIGDATTILPETLDQADYVVEDWLNSAQLVAVSELEAGMFRTAPLIQAAKSQLQAMHALEDAFVVDDSVHKQLRFVDRILYIQLLKQE